jgi:DNA-binding NtrC family response regulator
VIRDFVVNLGYEVSSFHTVSDFRESRIENPGPVDLILVDLEAPKAKGQVIINKINDICPSADIVIMSDGKGVLDFQEAVSHRVYSYLNKPVRLAELELMIARVKEKRSLSG